MSKSCHINHLSAFTTKLKNVERIHNSEKFYRYSSETSSYLHRLSNIRPLLQLLIITSIVIEKVLQSHKLDISSCLYDHEQSRICYKHSNHLQTTKTNSMKQTY
ncbi:unnamed protein product [Adineta ricciae]|uniref:Uncharacterized protein n=1 Tax=Adineta ricciae TaxID=249248 RepID=A0A813MNH8_ADIRI|nr:unnamed protein product [Adineta ricciae]